MNNLIIFFVSIFIIYHLLIKKNLNEGFEEKKNKKTNTFIFLFCVICLIVGIVFLRPEIKEYWKQIKNIVKHTSIE